MKGNLGNSHVHSSSQAYGSNTAQCLRERRQREPQQQRAREPPVGRAMEGTVGCLVSDEAEEMCKEDCQNITLAFVWKGMRKPTGNVSENG